MPRFVTCADLVCPPSRHKAAPTALEGSRRCEPRPVAPLFGATNPVFVRAVARQRRRALHAEPAGRSAGTRTLPIFLSVFIGVIRG